MAPKPHWGKWCLTHDSTDTDSAHTASYTQTEMSPEENTQNRKIPINIKAANLEIDLIVKSE